MISLRIIAATVAVCVILFAIYRIYTYITDAEIHILIDWGKTLQEEDVIDKIQSNPNLQYLKHIEIPSITYDQLQRMYEDTRSKSTNLYYYKKHNETLKKGTSPFSVYYFKDTDPTYDYIGKITSRKRSVNGTNLKGYIRRLYRLGFGIHITDTLSESKKHRRILEIE
jgi:hypothetical protein